MTLLAFALTTTAQNVYDHFYDAPNKGDNAEIDATIKESRSTDSQSPDRYIAEYNYYVNNALLYSGIVTTTEYPDADVHIKDGIYTLSDSTGNTAGYMYHAENWDDIIADSAITVITNGINAYPDRPDMHFGKIHFLRRLQRWNVYAVAIHSTLAYVSEHRKTIVFPGHDTPLIKGILEHERTLLEVIQDSPDSIVFATRIDLLRGIAKHMMRIYPNDIYSMNTMTVSYNLSKYYNNSLKWLLNAEEISPKNITVLCNIADTYHIA